MRRQGIGRVQALLLFYLLTVAVLCGAACYFAYQRQRTETIADMDTTLLRIEAEYENIVENFWDVYLPIYESGSATEQIRGYYADNDALTPYEVLELKTILQRMAQRDNRIRYVAVYAPERETNYIYYTEDSTLQTLPPDFPYLADLSAKDTTFAIYGEREEPVIAVAGGAPIGSGQGSVMIGYDSTALHQLAEQNRTLPGLQFGIIRQSEIIIGSADAADIAVEDRIPGSHTVIRTAQGDCLVSVSGQTPQESRVLYTVPYAELVWHSHRYTPLILLVVGILLVISLAAYRYSMRSIVREVGWVRTGLGELGQNHLDYRIRGDFHQPDLAEIADAVNIMAGDLKENIDRVQEYRERQRMSEMQELQAKFNPHFLYNSLEMFRARCYENGDEETADLIADTAAIFRGFINSRTFIPLREEMAFSRRYLSLLRARYGDAVEIRYDMDPAIMDYGIIRNVLQPVIENYFVHGIDPSRDDNVLLFTGRILDERTMLITVEDNGLGMEEDALEVLNQGLQEPIASAQESYGLKNLSQRLRLFYGEGYGLQLVSNPDGGLIIEMRAARMTCEVAQI